jgi:WD40 repeat protein
MADTTMVSAENPWPGLLSFREADQRWFQGRREETAELLQHIKRERLTVLFALSGLGKSSVMQAGLFPAVRREDIFPVYIRLDHAPQSPDLRFQVLEIIAQAGAEANVTVPAPRPGATLWEYFHSVDTEFWSGSRRVLPLLVFDQFEEIFTLGKSPERAKSSEDLLDELADLAEGTTPAAVQNRWAVRPETQDDYTDEGEFKLLISIREDFLPEYFDQRRRIAGVPQKRYRLRQLSGEGALAAVSQARDLIDETVAEQIVRYVAAGDRLGHGRGRPLKDLDVEPALLSVVCRELNSRRRERGEAKISADFLEGNQEQVLNDFYTRSLEGMPAPVRRFVEEGLITVGGARNSVALEDALAKGMSSETVEQLVERRLLRKEYRRNEVRIELTHDLLTGVVRTSRDRRRTEEALEQQRTEREAAVKQLRRTRMISVGIAAIAAVAVIAAVVAFQQRATARQQELRAEEETRRADEQRKRAEAALSAEALANLKAQEEARAKEEQRKIAAKNAEEAAASAESARAAQQNEALARKKAEVAAHSEADARKRAELAAQEEARQRQVAVQAERTAEAAQKNEVDARIATDNANKQLSEKNQQIQKEVSKELVSQAVGLVSTRRYLRALGEIARALTLDNDSLGARSLAFDQLVRGAWRQPVDPAQPAALPFIHPPFVHPAGVLFAVYSPDGRHIATTSRDNIIRVWDSQTGTSVEVGTQPAATSAAFSRDGRRLVTASLDQTARVWDIAAKSSVLELKHASRVTSATFSANGRMIVTTSQDKTAQLWDAATGAKIGRPLTHPMTVNFAAFSPQGNHIITACADGNARVWDVAEGTELFSVQHQGEVKSAAFSPDGRRFVTASSDSAARVWDARTHLPVGDSMQHSGPVYFATFSPDGLRVATASRDQTSRIWEAATGRPITAPLEHKAAVLAATFSPDGARLVTASDDKTAQIWDVWHSFESVSDLIKLLEGVSGLDSSQDNTPALPDADRARRLSDLESKATRQPPTNFLAWFLTARYQNHR